MRGVTGSNWNARVVAERAVQAQVRIVARERGDDLAHRGEHGGAPAPVLLRDQSGRFGDRHAHLVRAVRRRGLARPGQRGAEHGQQHRAAPVQRADGDHPPVRHDLRAGVHVGQVPAAVPARVLHPGAEHSAAALVHLRAHLVDVVGAEPLLGTDHPHLAAGDRLGPLAARCLRSRGRSVRLSWAARSHRVRLSCRVHVCSPVLGPVPGREKRPPLPGDRFWSLRARTSHRLRGGATTGSRARGEPTGRPVLAPRCWPGGDPPEPPAGSRPRSFVTGPWPCWPGGRPPGTPSLRRAVRAGQASAKTTVTVTLSCCVPG